MLRGEINSSRVQGARRVNGPALRALLLVAALAAAASPGAAAASGGHWQTLFDGTSLEHWRGYGSADVDARWQIEGEDLVLTARGGGDLITRESYADFELELEWQIAEGGNSGIFILADEGDKPIYVHAPEVQILDNERHSDRHKASRRSGSLYDLIAAPAASQKPAGAWNRVRIRHQAGQLAVWQNDVPVADIELGSDAWNALVADSKFADWQGFGENRSGHIGLQDHGDRVAFRNIRVRRLGD